MSVAEDRRQEIVDELEERRQHEVDQLADAAAEALRSRRRAIAADPTLSTITLVLRLDRGGEVLYRTESAPVRRRS